jgi:WASH complex subunit strumpellin
LFPEYKIPPNATKLYLNAIKKLENLFLPMLKIVRRLGQGQLLRRQIANSLQLGCQLEAHHLFQALDTFNIALVSELRNPAMNQVLVQDAAAKTLCYETAILIESCGLDDPLAKVYVTSAPLEGLPVMIFLFILAYLPKLEYDANFGALVRRKAKFPLDGVPMVVGLACLLRQFHPSYTRKVLAYLGQFVRASLSEAFADVDNKAEEVPRDVLNVLVFLEQLCKHTGTPRQLVYDFVPAYIFDALSFATAKK